MRTRTFGIFAHIDAGKTTFTESILFNSNLISAKGSVQEGTTESDSTEEEIRRGISIYNSFFQFGVQGSSFVVFDTPGHYDFRYEVEKVLPFLDFSILLLNAKKGVEAQTLILFDLLKRNQIPILACINFADAGAESVLKAFGDLEEMASPIVCLSFSPLFEETYSLSRKNISEAEILKLLEQYPEFEKEYYQNGISSEKIQQELFAISFRDRKSIPVFKTSAKENLGVEQFLKFLPKIAEFVFSNPAGKKAAIPKIWEGQRTWIFRSFADQKGNFSKLTGLSFEDSEEVRDGDIFKTDARGGFAESGNGDIRGDDHNSGANQETLQSRDDDISRIPSGDRKLNDAITTTKTLPTLSVFVRPNTLKDQPKLEIAMEEIRFVHPEIQTKFQEEEYHWEISGRGELQLEVILETLQKKLSNSFTNSKIQVAEMELYQSLVKSFVFEHSAFENSFSSGSLEGTLESLEDFTQEINFQSEFSEETKSVILSAFKDTVSHGPFDREVVGLKLNLIRHHFPSDLASYSPPLLKVAIVKGMKELLQGSTTLVGPLAFLTVRVSEEFIGTVLNEIQRIDGKIHSIKPTRGNESSIEFQAPLQKVLGFSWSLQNMTRGTGSCMQETVFNSKFFARLS